MNVVSEATPEALKAHGNEIVQAVEEMVMARHALIRWCHRAEALVDEPSPLLPLTISACLDVKERVKGLRADVGAEGNELDALSFNSLDSLLAEAKETRDVIAFLLNRQAT